MRIKYLLVILLVFIGINSVKAIDVNQKVYDFANVLTEEQETNLKEKISNYTEISNMDMALITVRHHNYSSTEKYADAIHDELIANGFGKGEHNDSIICIIDFNTNFYKLLGFQISTNGEAIKLYDDYRIERILDSMDVEFNNDNYNYYSMFNAFIDKSTDYAKIGVPDSNKNMKIDKNGKPYIERPFPWVGISIFSIIISTIIVVILIKRNKMVYKSTNADLYIDKNSINITNKNDQFLTTATTRVRIYSDSSSGSRGHVGGSSFHSSGGGFHGGGGRGH